MSFLNKTLKLNTENKSLKFISGLLFVLSGAAMTAMLTLSITGIPGVVNRNYLYDYAGVVLSAVIFAFAIFKFNILSKIFGGEKIWYIALCVFFAVFTSYIYFEAMTPQYQSRSARFHTILLTAVICAIPMVCAMYTFAYRKLYDMFLTLKPPKQSAVKLNGKISFNNYAAEKVYLICMAAAVVITIIYVFNRTGVFYKICYASDGQPLSYDLIYSMDSSVEVSQNIYFISGAIENDLRNPLFGIFAAPFALPCMIISKILYSVPNAYPIAIDIVQCMLIAVSIVMIARMLRLNLIDNIFFLIIATFTYGVLLHFFTMGGYVFSTFWLIFFLYLYMQKSPDKYDAFFAATGTLTSNVVLMPLILNKKDGAKIIIRNIFLICLILICLFIVFGHLPHIGSAVEAFKFFGSFTGAKLGFAARVKQYFNFASSVFFAPDTEIIDMGTYSVFRQLPPGKLNITGAAVLIFSLVGAILNRRNKFAKLCACWAVFSVIVCCVIGWGTFDNALIVYALYFGWAFISLVFMGITHLLKRRKVVRIVIFAAFAAALCLINIPGVLDLLRFAVANYPA